MRNTVWSADALEARNQASLTQRQRSVIEGLIRALEPSSFLSEHAGGTSSAVLALIRAHHALDGYARLDQPQIRLTKSVLKQALQAVKVTGPAYSMRPTGVGIIAQAQQLLTAVVTDLNRTPRPTATDKQRFAGLAAQIDGLVLPTRAAARAALNDLWSGCTLSDDVVSRIRGEIAVLVFLEGRGARSLRTDLQNALRQQRPLGAAALSDVLWPTPRTYRVSVIVSGARSLEHLDQLLPGARQYPLPGDGRGLPANFPGGSPEMRDLVLAARPQVGSATLVQVTESAADAQTAIERGRRKILETLDQYVAGRRLLDLRISSRSLATDSEEDSFAADTAIGGGAIARPLTAHWSDSLRPALRTANLARQVEAPVASVALSWSAVESLEAGSGTAEILAKACVLHALRQQVLSVFMVVVESGVARLRHAQWRVDGSQRLLTSFESRLAGARRGQKDSARQAAAVLGDKVAEYRLALADAEVELERLNGVLMPHLAVVRRMLLGGDNSKSAFDVSSWKLIAENVFLDSLLPPRNTISSDETQLRIAVETLAQAGGGLAAELFAIWRGRLASPAALSDWLDEQQQYFHALLSWMYVSRNLSIHSGQFAVPADVLTAHSSHSLVDMVLEFLGNWHQVERKRNMADSHARDILSQLATRNDILTGKLRSASSCHPLNIVAITAPDGDAWTRP